MDREVYIHCVIKAEIEWQDFNCHDLLFLIEIVVFKETLYPGCSLQ